ncbi:MAG: penicillin-binding transpeptidase domain-containing protein [bacterium]
MKRVGGGIWRLWTMQGLFLLVVLTLAGRFIYLQIWCHDEYKQIAEAQWKSRQPLPANRGNLYDRTGRSLALSVISYRIGVACEEVQDAGSVAAKLSTILPTQLGGQSRSIEQRIKRAGDDHLVLVGRAVLSSSQLAALRRIDPPVTLERRADRAYPLNGTGASVIGFFRNDGRQGDIATGLEQSLDIYLSGTPGEAVRVNTAHGGQSLGQIVLKSPSHGRNLVLTLDADLQTVAENQLERSVAACRAKGGTVLIADPENGDILAAASWPLLKDRKQPGRDTAVWDNFNFSGIYEPGSVFKLFTTASLLGNGAIDTATTYDCDNSDFGGYRIHNCEDEPYGQLPLLPALVHSINIYFARGALNLENGELYRDLTDFGFGQRTRFPYPAQAAGILNHPAHWSRRSKATIAIGQEVAVTPLQLVMATCAIANGGYLYAPRVVREIRDNENRLLEQCPPIPLHRVMSEPLSRMLREGMARVVAEGTGQAARLGWVDCGGKTGTAQKSLDGCSYTPGKYMASFVGCVPSEKPRLVILTMLDEPDWAHHWAAQSAVPLFAEVVSGVRRASSWLSDLLGRDGSEVVNIMSQEMVVVPDVLLLSSLVAQEEVRRAGLVLTGGEKTGVVMEQIPGPGAICPRGSQVEVTVATERQPAPGAEAICPDLFGLSNREVLRIAASLGTQVSMAGAGYVVSQQPEPGSSLDDTGIRVQMGAPWSSP